VGVLRDLRAREQYGRALLLLALAYLLSAFDSAILEDISGLIFILILLMIMANKHVPRRLRVAGFTAAGVSLLLSLTRVVATSDATVALDAFSTMTAIALTIPAILVRLLRHKTVTAPTVMGAFLCYALVGFAAAYLFIGVDAVTSEPFFSQGQTSPGDFIYFAMVTLTTVGYGDLTAATVLGKRLVVIEAVMGQVFLVVLLARMVSLWQLPQRVSRTEDE
jgi:voltage-gated potassium channel Kch